MSVTRREFFVKTLQGVAIIAIPTALGTLLESCKTDITGPTGATMSKMQGTLSNGVVTINIDSSSPLSVVGSAASVDYSSGSLLVDHPSTDTFNAFSSICTHQGCTIDNFDTGTENFVCTCHNSRFGTDGKVVNGPASSPLPQYKTVFANNQLKITI